MQDNNIPWIEKYRPLHFDNIVLDPINKTLFKNILTHRIFPNLLFYGPPGTGKTTTIINLINEYTGLKTTPTGKNKENVIHLNASDERGIDIIRYQINQFVKSNHLFETGLKFVILDEVDYMTKNAHQALKSLIQTCRSNVRFCLICNYISKIDDSLQNEFCCVRFNQLPLKDIYTFIRHIADAEEVALSQEDIEMIQINYQSDIRSMINFIQLNSNTFCKNERGSLLQTKIVRSENWNILHNLLSRKNQPNSFQLRSPEFPLTPDAKRKEFFANTISDSEKYIHHISIHFNIDKRNILNMYFNYVIRTYPEVVKEEWLDIAENIIHTTDSVEIKDVLQFFCVNLASYYARYND
jgi:DNA polymerase III delta prime subunit